MASNSKELITLTYLNGTGYLFNADDYLKIRKEHRIVGAMVGTCSARGWTPGLNGLPVELSKFETQLLLENGEAILVDKSASVLNLNKTSVENYKLLVEKRIIEQEKCFKNNKITEYKKHINSILTGKKNKLETQDVTLSESDVLKEVTENFKFNKKDALLDVPYNFVLEHEGVVRNLTDKSMNYKVFKEVWNKGKYITSGESFGADFIVYPGDPLLFHASHILIILQSSSVDSIEIINKCRLSVIVNKKCTFVYCNKRNVLCYQIVEWANLKK